MSVIISSGSQRVNTKERTKFYAPYVEIPGKRFHLKRVQATATNAKQYAARFASRYPGFERAAKVWAVRQGKETMTVFTLLLKLLSILLKHGNLKIKIDGSGLNWDLKQDDVEVRDDLDLSNDGIQKKILWIDTDL